MVSRKSLAAFGLAGLLSGSTAGYADSLACDQPSYQTQESDLFKGSKVMLLYPTLDGPRLPSDTRLYEWPRPVDSVNLDFISGVQKELYGREAFVLPGGAFVGSGSIDSALSQTAKLTLGSPKTGIVPDYIVIVGGDRESSSYSSMDNNVYFASRDGHRYNFERAEVK
ncbi:MAG: hypothetical protein AABW71_02925 [Nanoarchaeota archaeon]